MRSNKNAPLRPEKTDDLCFEFHAGACIRPDTTPLYALDQINLIFSNHVSKSDAEYVVNQINRLKLDAQLKSIPLALWHELGCPIGFPMDVVELAAMEHPLARNSVISKIAWHEELASGSLSQEAFTALKHIHLSVNKSQVPSLQKLFTPGSNLDSFKNSQHPEWLEYYRSVANLSSSRQPIHHIVESPPIEALVHMLFSKYQQQKSPSFILAGDYEPTVLTLAREVYHNQRFQEIRDHALAAHISTALISDNSQLQVCIRGIQHRTRLLSILQSTGAKVGNVLSSAPDQVVGELSTPLHNRISSIQQLSAEQKDHIFSLLFANLTRPYFKSDPSLEPILCQIAKEIPPPQVSKVLVEALQRSWSSIPELAKHVTMWFLSHEYVKNNPCLYGYNDIRLA